MVDSRAAGEEDPDIQELVKQPIHILMRINTDPLPEITENAREYARTHPDSWMYYTDSTLPPDAPVVLRNCPGARYINEQGEFSGLWINESFLPQPAFAKREFHNMFELVLWRVLYGYHNLGALAANFAEHTHLVVIDPETDEPRVHEFVDARFGLTRRGITVFTSQPLVAPEAEALRPMTGLEIMALGDEDAELWAVLNKSPEGDGLGLQLGLRDLTTLLHQHQVFSRKEAEWKADETAQAQASNPDRPQNAQERFLGAMLGGAMGDALGYAVEFNDIDMIRRHHGADGVTGPVLRDGVAQVSDDTQMMLFTLEGLIRAHVARRMQPRDNDPVPEVQHAYQRWYHTQGPEWRTSGGPYAQHLQRPDGWLITNRDLFASRAPGSTCMSALANFAQTGVFATPQHRINNSKGCGGVMRAAPVAAWSNDPSEVFLVAVRTAALTHSHPSGFLSAGVLAVIVHQLLREVPLRDAVRMARDLLTRWPEHEEQLQVLDRAVALAERGRMTPEELKAELGEGWVGEEALAIGLYAVLATDNLRDALLLSVNHSGDSDSTGIVCGNIGGALYGTRAIPADWLQTLELRQIIETITNDALAEFSPGPPTDPSWPQRYPAW